MYCSEVLPVVSGVPQESMLGPILFLLYVNNIPDFILHSKSFSYADDTKFYQPIKIPIDYYIGTTDWLIIRHIKHVDQGMDNVFQYIGMHFSRNPKGDNCYYFLQVWSVHKAATAEVWTSSPQQAPRLTPGENSLWSVYTNRWQLLHGWLLLQVHRGHQNEISHPHHIQLT